MTNQIAISILTQKTVVMTAALRSTRRIIMAYRRSMIEACTVPTLHRIETADEDDQREIRKLDRVIAKINETLK